MIKNVPGNREEKENKFQINCDHNFLTILQLELSKDHQIKSTRTEPNRIKYLDTFNRRSDVQLNCTWNWPGNSKSLIRLTVPELCGVIDAEWPEIKREAAGSKRISLIQFSSCSVTHRLVNCCGR